EPCHGPWAQPALTADAAAHIRPHWSAADKSDWNGRSGIAPTRRHAPRLRAGRANTPPEFRWRSFRRPALRSFLVAPPGSPQKYIRTSHSAARAGFAWFSISTTTPHAISIPPSTSRTAFGVTRARILDPTITGAGKRRRLNP